MRRRLKSHRDGNGGWQRPWGFAFDSAVCGECELRPRCVASRKGKGRTVTLHPQEALLQEARALQRSEAFNGYRKLRQVSEHRIARLVQLGIRQSRYFGRTKTRFQILLAATVANLTLVATAMGMMHKPYHKASSYHVGPSQHIMSGVKHVLASLRCFLVFLRLSPQFQYRTLVRIGGYRPDF